MFESAASYQTFVTFLSFFLGLLLIISLFWGYHLLRELSGKDGLIAEKEKENAELSAQSIELQLENASITQELVHYEESKKLIKSYIDKVEALHGEKSLLYARNEALEMKLMEQEKHALERLELMRENKDEIKNEFERLASRVLESNSRKFADFSKEGIGSILSPLGREIESFRKQVNETYEKESRDRILLQNEITLLKELNTRMSVEAVNLTKALKGESKRQGVWGEMVLEKVLEVSGLRKGIEYEREVHYRDDESRAYRPDVIVKLPENRDMIIDSKSSLVAYEHYMSSDDEAHRNMSLRQHIASLKKHIDGLSEKNYDRLRGANALDFVLMFVPIEGAFSLAIEHEPALYEYALRKKVLVVTPATLLIALRAVESVWRNERQHQNAKEIARLAGSMVDKFVLLGEDMLKVSKQLDGLQNSFLGVQNKLTTGKGNLVRQALRLRELGAQSTKEIPGELNNEQI